MLIYVPMAGFGDRYMRAGYKEPKPLIPVDGVTMIERVLQAFAPRQPGDRYLFTVNRQHAESTNVQERLRELVPDAKIVVVEPHKDGPIQTLLASAEHIDPDEEVLLNYCDFGVDWSYPAFREWLSKNKWDGAMSAYKGFHPHSLGPQLYAYMRVADDGETVTEIREKHHFTPDKFSEYASSGLYYFRSGRQLLDIAKEMIASGERVQGEFYVSMAVQALIAKQGRVGVFPLAHFYQWGTPDDLRDWEGWSRSLREIDGFTKSLRDVQSKSVHVVPMAGRGQRFIDQGYADPKPLIDVAGRPMIAQVLSMLPAPKERVLVALQEHAGDARFQATVREASGTTRIVPLTQMTEGQASTAALGLEGLDDSVPLLFAPCDAGYIYDLDAFLRLEAEPDCELAIFTASGHLPALWRPQMYGWVQRNEAGFAIKAAVKKLVDGVDARQQEVVTGTFWFKDKATFLREHQAMLAANDRVNNEFYIDTIARRMIDAGRKVRAFTVRKYIPWGTPEELRTFQYWNDVFRSGRTL